MLASVSGGCDGFPTQPLSIPSGPFIVRATSFSPDPGPCASLDQHAPQQLRSGNLPRDWFFCNTLLWQMSYLDAVADPVRLRIARRLAERGPASLPELAESADVHPNTARAHLEALRAAGVVSIESEHRPRGRPRTRYALTPGWTPADGGFRGLAEVLSAALVRSGVSERELHDLGVEWGRYLLGRPGEKDVER